MSKRFIPRGDDAFSEMAEAFALRIAREREQLGVSEDDSAALSAAAADFKARLFETRFGSGRGFAATQRKCEARREAERLINRMAAILRVSDAISPQDKERLRLHERPRRGKGPELPSEPPRLKFKRARHEGTGVAPLHELEFAEYHTLARTKQLVTDGIEQPLHSALRLELVASEASKQADRASIERGHRDGRTDIAS